MLFANNCMDIIGFDRGPHFNRQILRKKMCKNVEFKRNITKIEKLSIKKSKIQFVEVK